MLRQLNAQGEMGKESIEDNYVTFLASLFRRCASVRPMRTAARTSSPSTSSSAGRVRAWPDGKYRVDFAKMRRRAISLSRRILVLQGDGDYAGVGQLNSELGAIGATLKGDLDRSRRSRSPSTCCSTGLNVELHG
jgi:hypothetical protein